MPVSEPTLSNAGHGADGRGRPFDKPLPPGGYAWWYLDAISDDGSEGLTTIAFVGSVFSPWYAWSGWKDPADHCALNVALYRLRPRRGGAWAMTERGRRTTRLSADRLAVGASEMAWTGRTLRVEVDEVTVPLPSPLRGRISVTPVLGPQGPFALDGAGRHRWAPLAPLARVEVEFTHPRLKWSGWGYLDSNEGDEPIADAFRSWDWGRAHVEDGVVVCYDAVDRAGHQTRLRLAFGDAGLQADALARCPAGAATLFGLRRTGWAAQGEPTLEATLEDAPFYARSLMRTDLGNGPVAMMHETLDCDRLRSALVRAMLPFRMPRLAG
jgi:carotenoid 1,2-hydratase